MPNVHSGAVEQVAAGGVVGGVVGGDVGGVAGGVVGGGVVQPPDASWGSMLQRSTQFAGEAPWLVLLPGLAILLTVLALNTVGDAVRDSVGRDNRRLV